MMEFFGKTTRIDFMGQRLWAMVFSLLLFVVSIGLVAFKGLQLGLDFTGGTQVEMRFNAPVSVQSVRDTLDTHFKQAVVQSYGTSRDVLIRLAPNQTHSRLALKKTLSSMFPDGTIQRTEYIGPQVGKALINQGVLAIIASLIAIIIYITLRFEYRFAISAALSLVHDPILILGVFALFHLEFNLISLAAVLTILGYSLNDTIVVYDRVRENFRKFRKLSTVEIMNLSINQTLSRTIMTSGLTLLVVVALFLLGGETLRGFSIALIVGIVIGTYSSIYVAGALALWLGLDRNALLPSKPVESD